MFREVGLRCDRSCCVCPLVCLQNADLRFDSNRSVKPVIDLSIHQHCIIVAGVSAEDIKDIVFSKFYDIAITTK